MPGLLRAGSSGVCEGKNGVQPPTTPLSPAAIKHLHEYGIPVLLHCLATQRMSEQQHQKLMRKLIPVSGWQLDVCDTQPLATPVEQAALVAFILRMRAVEMVQGKGSDAYSSFVRDLSNWMCACTTTLGNIACRKYRSGHRGIVCPILEQHLWEHVIGFMRERIAEIPNEYRSTESFTKAC